MTSNLASSAQELLPVASSILPVKTNSGCGSTIAGRSEDSISRIVSASWHGVGYVDDISSFRLDPRGVQSLHAGFRPEQPWRAPQAPLLSSSKRRHGKFMLEAISIFSNILAGPGILQFPAMVSESGWLLSFGFLVLFAILTARTCSLLAKALKQMVLRERAQSPGLCPRFELSDLVQQTFGRRAFLSFQVVLNMGMLLLCLASVVAAAATVDRLLTVVMGNSYALALWGEGRWLQPACSPAITQAECGVDLFRSTDLGISAGYMLVLVVCLPLTFTNFANLMWFQYIALTVTLGAVLTFAVTCFTPSTHPQYQWHAPPAIGSDPTFAISTCFFSFAIGFAVPSWWNENEVDCPASTAINASMAYTFLVYYVPIAMLPAFAFLVPSDQSALDLFLNGDVVNAGAVIAAYFLAILGIMPNVVAYSVAMRDNLQALGPKFTFRRSLLIGCVGPFLLGWLLDNPTGFGATFLLVIKWGALALLGGINFLMPLLIVCKLASEPADRSNSPEKDYWSKWELREAQGMLVVVFCLLCGGYLVSILR